MCIAYTVKSMKIILIWKISIRILPRFLRGLILLNNLKLKIMVPKALTPRAWISLLRSQGIEQIDREESSSILSIVDSCAECGCSCPGPCTPADCSCAVSGLQCCVETADTGPCKCAGKACYNQEGRRLFDSMQVDMHFITTIIGKGGGMNITEDAL